MTPRAFVESLRNPVSARLCGVPAPLARAGEIEGWFSAGGERIWGAGGAAFIRQARTRVLMGGRAFEEWLDSLPQPKVKP